MWRSIEIFCMWPTNHCFNHCFNIPVMEPVLGCRSTFLGGGLVLLWDVPCPWLPKHQPVMWPDTYKRYSKCVSVFHTVKQIIWHSTAVLWSSMYCSTQLAQDNPSVQKQDDCIRKIRQHFFHILQSHLSNRYLTRSMQRAQGRAA